MHVISNAVRLRVQSVSGAWLVRHSLWLALAAVILSVMWLGSGVSHAQGPKTYHVDDDRDEGLVAFWTFNSTLDDSSGNANHALAQSSYGFINVRAPTSHPNSYSLLTYSTGPVTITVADHSSLNLHTSFSVAAWVKRTVTNTFGTLYDSGTQANHWYFGFLSNNRLAFTESGLADYQSSSSAVITDTQWHHVAVVKDGDGPGNVTLYLDGAPVGTHSVGSVTPPSGVKRIANKQTGSTPYRGHLDELRIYNRALSAAEIGRLAAGRGCVSDGLSWPSAFPDLQCGLEVAVSGDEVWVTRGLYRPGIGRQPAFDLRNGVGVYGGFLGSETSRSQRPPFVLNDGVVSNPGAYSILSGDWLGNDDPALPSSLNENSFHVVYGRNVGPSTRLDGFVIRSGRSSTGLPMYDFGRGSGIFLGRGAPTLSNLIVIANVAWEGSGLTVLNDDGSQPSLSNVVFRDNYASDRGGALANLMGGRVLLTNTWFLSNTAVYSGGAILNEGILSLSNATLGRNLATDGDGGAIWNSADLHMSNSSLGSNWARRSGGAIYNDITSTLTRSVMLTDVTLLGNKAEMGMGGGMANLSASGAFRVALRQVNLTGNLALNGLGGGIFTSLDGSGSLSLSLDQVTLTDNRAGLGGGMFSERSLVQLTNSYFISNTALTGGGLYNSSGGVQLASSQFVNNAADTLGGGLYNASGSVQLTNSQFNANRATIGAGLYNESGPVHLVDSQFARNVATNQGGGLAHQFATLTVTGTRFAENTAQHGGGMWLNASSSATITNAQFLSNTASQSGGGLRNQATSLLLHGAVFRGNSAAEGGGLVVASGGVTLTHTSLLGNQAPTGAAIRTQNASLGLVNALVVGNQGADGAALFAQTSNLRLINVTVVSNTAQGAGAVIKLLTAGGSLGNGIVWANASTVIAGVNRGDVLAISYSLVQGGAGGPGNLNADPRFVRLPDLAVGDFGDLHLSAGSPAIDAGDNNALPPGISTDLDGNPRFVDVLDVPDTGNGAPPLVDMGVYEADLVMPPSPNMYLSYVPLVLGE